MRFHLLSRSAFFMIVNCFQYLTSFLFKVHPIVYRFCERFTPDIALPECFLMRNFIFWCPFTALSQCRKKERSKDKNDFRLKEMINLFQVLTGGLMDVFQVCDMRVHTTTTTETGGHRLSITIRNDFEFLVVFFVLPFPPLFFMIWILLSRNIF